MIKKLLAAFALITSFAATSNAQEYTPLVNPLDSFTYGNVHQIEMSNYVTNNAADSIAFTWKVVYVQMPVGWNAISLCDNITCFGDSQTMTGIVSHTTSNFEHNQICKMVLFVSTAAPTINEMGIVKVRTQTTLYNNMDTLGQIDTLVFRINPAAATGINVINANDASVKISPNPAKEALVIFADKALHASKISIINLTGQVAYTTAITNETTHININNLANGLYMVSIFDDQGRMVTIRKFIKD